MRRAAVRCLLLGRAIKDGAAMANSIALLKMRM